MQRYCPFVTLVVCAT